MTTGIDVSEFSFNPGRERALARAAIEAGHEFAILRTSSGLVGVNHQAAEVIAGFREECLEVLAGYHYLFSNVSGERQAEHAHATMLSLGLPACIVDTEPRPQAIPSDAPRFVGPVLTAYCRRWRELTNAWPTVYGGAAYLAAMGLPEEMAECALWLPQWTAGEPTKAPAPWTFHVLWQVAGNVALHNDAGVMCGHVDTNETRWSVAQLSAALNGTAKWSPVDGSPNPP